MESLNKNWLAILIIAVVFFLLGFLIAKSCQSCNTKCKNKAAACHVERGKSCGAIKAHRGAGNHHKKHQELEDKSEE